MASDEPEVMGGDAPGSDWSVFWERVLWWAPNTLATSVDVIVRWLWGGGALTEAMDTLNTLLLGWLFSFVLILILAKFLYDKFLCGSDDEEYFSDSNSGVVPCGDEAGGGGLLSTAAAVAVALEKKRLEARREPTIVPKAVSPGSAGSAAGQDADAVRWINTVTRWLYRGPHKAVARPYLAVLNDMTTQTALETGVLIEVLEILPATPSPVICNVVVDCFPNDTMSLTCDCEGQLYLRLQTTRTHRGITTESEYAAAVQHLRGRLNARIQSHQCDLMLKFDGWPEVSMELEGIRNNEEGLGEKELQEVIKEVVCGAIRSMVLDINFEEEKTFPRFKRAREQPDKVIPVGYDSMVREQQTHPPVLKPKAPVKPRDIPSVSLKDNRYVPDDLAGYDAIQATNNNKLTPNVSAVLRTSEEPLTASNSGDYDRKDPYHEHDGILLGDHFKLGGNQRIPWERGYVPTGFLEQVTAVAMAKVEEKNFAEPADDEKFALMTTSREKLLDEPEESQAFDYIPYDSEYEEDEDADDYLERKPVAQMHAIKKSPAPVFKADEVFIPTESDSKSLLGKNADILSSKPLVDVQTKAIEAVPQSVSPLGAMGLPHHPKSHFTPTLSPPTPPTGLAALNGKRLLVKMVKATTIGSHKSSVDGYVVVEMDEPNQKFTTATVRGSNSPFWDEQFLFDLSDITLELLFELYDESDSAFLGLGIVGIEELMATPSQRQIIPLQARPYEDDAVSGSITVEFLFLEGGDLPELTVRSSAVQQSRGPHGLTTTTTTTTYEKKPLAADVLMNGSDSVAASALRDITSKSPAPLASKSTIVIHSSRKPEDEPEEQEYDSDDGNYVENTLQYPFPSTTAPTTSTTTSPPLRPSYIVPTIANDAAAADPIDYKDDDRGRSRNKRKGSSFFGTLKKRFSRSKVRSQSVDPTAPQKREGTPNSDAPRTATVGRSVSMERSTRLRPGGLLSVPKSENRESLGRVAVTGDTSSTRSSLSEASGLSSSSTRTYVNEASMLIVETVENGVVKHYLVPVSLQQRNRWRKRGTKLHVFSGHTFVAKHISSSEKCCVCEKSFNRRPGKQGYECRDCSIRTHKPCHVRTELQCPNSKVNNMDLEYIKDPREERREKRNQRL